MYQLSLLARVHCLGQFFWEEGTETGIWQVGEGVHEGLWGSGQGRGSGVCVHVGIQEASWRRWAHGNSSKGRGKIDLEASAERLLLPEGSMALQEPHPE